MSSTERAPEPTMDEILASIRRLIADDGAPAAQPAPAAAMASVAPRPAPGLTPSRPAPVFAPPASAAMPVHEAVPVPAPAPVSPPAPVPPPAAARKEPGRSSLTEDIALALRATEEAVAAELEPEEDILDLTNEVFELDEVDTEIVMESVEVEVPAPAPPKAAQGAARKPAATVEPTFAAFPEMPTVVVDDEGEEDDDDDVAELGPDLEIDDSDDDDEDEAEVEAEAETEADYGRAAASPARSGVAGSLEDCVREMLRPMLREWLDDNLPRILEAAVREEVGGQVRTRQRQH
jgi:cell pole-organizing protein PopZ